MIVLTIALAITLVSQCYENHKLRTKLAETRRLNAEWAAEIHRYIKETIRR